MVYLFFTGHSITVPAHVKAVTAQTFFRDAFSRFTPPSGATDAGPTTNNSNNSATTNLDSSSLTWIQIYEIDSDKKSLVYTSDSRSITNDKQGISFQLGWEVETKSDSNSSFLIEVLVQDISHPVKGPSGNSEKSSKSKAVIGSATLSRADIDSKSIQTLSVNPTTTIENNESSATLQIEWKSNLPAIPWRDEMLKNSVSRFYKFNNALSVEEVIGEVSHSVLVPQLFLKICKESMVDSFESWRKRYDAARISQCLFNSAQEGLAHGHDCFKIGVVAALKVDSAVTAAAAAAASTVQTVAVTATPPPSSSSKGSGPNAFLNRFKQKAGKWGAAQATKLEGAISASFSNTQVNPQVAVALHQGTSDGIMIGKTNTEYNTTSPVWGTNTRVQACDHTRPNTKHYCYTRIHSRVETTNAGEDNNSVKRFVFYQKTMGKLSGSLRLIVMNETYGLLNGVESVPIGYVIVNFADFLPAFENSGDGTQTFSTSDWFPIYVQDSNGAAGGKLTDATLKLDIVIHLAANDNDESLNADAIALEEKQVATSVGAGNLGFLHSSKMILQSLPSYKELPLSFMYTHVLQLKRDLAFIDKLISVCDDMKRQNRYFRSSADKKTLVLQAIATNLHVGTYQYFTEGDCNSGLFTCTTSGAPTAHALGLQEFGLCELEREILRLEKLFSDSLETSNSGKESAKALRIQAPASVPEDSLENLFQLVSPLSSSKRLDSPASFDDPSPLSPSGAKEKGKGFNEKTKQKFMEAFQPLRDAAKGGGGGGSANSENSAFSLLARLEELQAKYYLRNVVCLSQGLSIVITSFISHVQAAILNGNVSSLVLMTKLGFLVGWESLISSTGKELHMLSDVWGVVKMLPRFHFVLKSDKSSSPVSFVPYSDTCGIHINIENLPSEIKDCSTSIVPVLFTQGINEMQTIANIVGHHGGDAQKRINASNLSTIKGYYQKFVAENSGSNDSKHLLHLVTQLENAIREESHSNKDTSILLYAADVVRGLNGARITYCKSGKDRTAMSVTLEAVRVVSESNTKSQCLEMANVMREKGVRLHVAEKNIGRPKYSFNALQRKMLPEMYRPPISTIQDLVTSVTARDS